MVVAVGAAVLLLSAGLTVTVNSAESEILLGDATGFSLLAGTTITNSGPTVVVGDIGVSPGNTTPGYDEMIHTGTRHAGDTAAADAQADLTTAYNDAAGRTPSTVATELGSTTKGAGVYDSLAGTFEITGTLTLDADNDPNAFFIFQTESTLLAAANSTVSLINGANPCNVFWQVGSSATINANATFKGTVMALTMIEVLAGANIQGRLLARNASVTLLSDTITLSACVAAAPSGSPTGGPGGPTASPTRGPGTVPSAPNTDALPGAGGSMDPAGPLLVILLGVAAASLLLLRPSRRRDDRP